MIHVVIDPSTGAHLRAATAAEVQEFVRQNAGRRRGAGRAVLVGGALVDTWNGPGIWFGGAGF